MLAGRRQLSLDETGRRRLTRQASEVRPIIAWQETVRQSVEKEESQVEVVAKKIGQPKPIPIRPLRSPSIKNESCLTISRRQVAERLKVGWNKVIGKEGQEKKRQNINIFLNKSFEAQPPSPRTPELGNGFLRSQSLYVENDDEGDITTDTESDDNSSVEETPPVPRAVIQLNEQPASPQQKEPQQQQIRQQQNQQLRQQHQQQQQQQQHQRQQQQQQQQRQQQQQNQQQRLSASARRAAFKATGRQRPTTCSPPRLMSAPPQSSRTQTQPDQAPSVERAKSAPPRRRQQRKPRRGVVSGEVVTMVSLVSPAESEEEEIIPLSIATPEEPSPLTSAAPSPLPPPILSLRRPFKAVTFKSSEEGPQFRTSYPLRTTTILQEEKESGGSKKETAPLPIAINQPRVQPSAPPPHQHQAEKTIKHQNTLPSKTKPQSLQRQASRPPAEKKDSVEDESKPKSVTVKVPQIKEKMDISSNVTIKGAKEDKVVEVKKEDQVAKDEETEKSEEDGPVFKSAKEQECWQLFKRMSSRGVSVSFETVLRGLLTPTEYRLRRGALLASY